MQKRKFLLTGSIIGVVMSALQALGCIVIMAMFNDLIAMIEGSAASLGAGLASYSMDTIYVIMGIAFVLCVTVLILNILALRLHRVPKANFKKGLVITTAVLNFVLAGICIFGGMGFVQILVIGSFILAGIFQVIDACKEKNRVEDIANGTTLFENTGVGAYNRDTAYSRNNTNQTMNVQNYSNANEDKFEKSLAKLRDLRDRGEISAEEYDSLRKKIIEKQLMN